VVEAIIMKHLRCVAAANLLVMLAAFIGAVSIGTSDLAAQSGNIKQEAADLIVRLETQFGGEEPEDSLTEIGSGIVVGMDEKSVWITTARHAVCKERGCGEIWVVSISQPSRKIRAQLVDKRRPGLDLAIITVPRAGFNNLGSGDGPEFNRRGRVGSLHVGDPVYPVGCPLGECDKTASPPDRVVSNDGRNISFLSLLVGTGSSGGAIFDRDWEVVGMVFYDQQPFGIALSIDTVLAAANSMGYPPSLKRPFLPRSGYRTTIGVSFVVPIPFDDVISEVRDKVAGRVSLIHRTLPAVSWHVAGLRLRADNLSTNGLLAGIGFYPTKPGRFGLRFFAEVGFGRTEARFDTGGYFTTDGNGDGYVPVWGRAEQTELGGGGGVSFELLLLPRTILEVVGGYWSFPVPEMPGIDETYILAPTFSHLQVGAGLRFGL
jgi:S1-C subfamily serine protease